MGLIQLWRALGSRRQSDANDEAVLGHADEGRRAKVKLFTWASPPPRDIKMRAGLRSVLVAPSAVSENPVISIWRIMDTLRHHACAKKDAFHHRAANAAYTKRCQ